MPTRFYFSNDQTSPISPAFDASWEQTGQAVRRYSPRKQYTTQASALANGTAITVPITTTQQILNRQFITDGLPYRVRIAGRIDIVIRGLENATTNNVFLAFVLRLLSNDGATVRGTLGSSMTNVGTEFVATAATRTFAAFGLSGTPITGEPGDRLCLEIGGHAQAPTAAGSYTYRYGHSAASDFALTSALTTDLNPWWQLDQDLWSEVPNNQRIVKGESGLSVSESWR